MNGKENRMNIPNRAGADKVLTETEFDLAQATECRDTPDAATWTRRPVPDFTIEGTNYWTEESVKRWLRMQTAVWKTEEDVVVRLAEYVCKSQYQAHHSAPTIRRRVWEVHRHLDSAGIDLHDRNTVVALSLLLVGVLDRKCDYVEAFLRDLVQASKEYNMMLGDW
jgi:hypothetical protein